MLYGDDLYDVSIANNFRGLITKKNMLDVIVRPSSEMGSGSLNPTLTDLSSPPDAASLPSGENWQVLTQF
jgi:hypothetical protein